MLPVLFSIGPFEFRTINIFFVVAFLLAGFVFWRRGRDEYYEEDELFDGFVIAIISGFILARVGFILINLDKFGFDVVKWLDVFSIPGLNAFFGAVGGTLSLARFAAKKNWDVFEILDYWSQTLALALSILWLGAFFEGVGFGNATKMPWGIVFPGVFDKHHPAQLYATVAYIALFIFLSRLEYTYRLYEWYKAKRKSAQSGFLFSVFLICHGLINILLSSVMPPVWLWQGIHLGVVSNVFIIFVGGVFLYFRSGRTLPFLKR